MFRLKKLLCAHESNICCHAFHVAKSWDSAAVWGVTAESVEKV